MSLVDPLGRILTEIRDDATVASLTDGRVRGGEPTGKSATYEGDALGAGHYKRFVILSVLGRQRAQRLPLVEVRIGARCYAATAQAAGELAGAVSDAIHAVGPRISPAGIGIWTSFDDGSEGASKDPDTGQPVETLVISVNAADRPIG